MNQKSFSLLLALLLSACTLQAQAPAADDTKPRNVILFISDGCGPASFTMARDFQRVLFGDPDLTLDALQVGGVHTFASDSRVTDSAASATAYACGVKTYNGAIGVDTLRQPVATLVEAAEARGLATGLVATSRITHATPAAFAAHVPNRAMEGAIADQALEQGIDVLMGGGWSFFVPADSGGSRTDARNLIREAGASGYQVVLDREAFDKPLRAPVLALFTRDHMSYEIDRDPAQEPSLAEMTTRAIDLLKGDPDGFFLMVEGSRIDHAAHGNDAAGHLHDIFAFDEAVAAALAFAQENGETLIVSTSDHETGGLTLGRDGVYDWHPERLARVAHSSEKISRLLAEGMAVEQVVHEELGIDDLTAEEDTSLAHVYAQKNGGALMAKLNDLVARRSGIAWTTGGHTAVDVNLYAYGPGSNRFAGSWDNTYLGLAIATLLDLDLQAVTETLRHGSH